MESSLHLSSSAEIQPPVSSKRMALYLCPLAGLPIFMVVAALFIIPTQWFALHSGDTYLPNLGYGDTLQNSGCDIVIYGDSTALVGIDTNLLHERTGLTACNVAEFRSMTQINGTMVLDRFVAHNPRPRFIVLMFAPEDFDPHQSGDIGATFEAFTYLMRQPDRYRQLTTIAAHPADFFKWEEFGLRRSLSAIGRPAATKEASTIRARNGGQYRYHFAALERCDYQVPEFQPDAAWVHTLRSKYAAPGTTVLINVTPMPPCDPTFPYYKERLSGLTDNALGTLPVGDYTREGHLHVNAAGSQLLSEALAEQILAHKS